MKYLIVKTDYIENNLTSSLYAVYEDLTFEEVQKYLKKHTDIENITIYEQGKVFDRVDSIGKKFLNINFKDCKSGYATIEKYKNSIKVTNKNK